MNMNGNYTQLLRQRRAGTARPTTTSSAVGRARCLHRAAGVVVAAALLAGFVGFAASSSNTGLVTDYNSFRIISQRNIFNQSRMPHTSGQKTYYRPPPSPPRAVSDAFALVGTLAYDTNRFAYFDGAYPEYHCVLKPGQMIGGYKLLAVMPNSVALDASGKAFEMTVGTQLRRFAEGGAQLTSNTDYAATADQFTTSATGTVSSVRSATGAPGSGGPALDANEVLRKLMEKRAQELK